MSGTLYLVGVGPGDPELLTLKAVRILAMVDLVAFPQKPGTQSLAHAIAAAHIVPKTGLLPFALPMLVDRSPAQKAYEQLALELSGQLEAGKNIAYLCEGDPLFYGSAMYLISRMEPVNRIVIIPGITSLGAGAAAIARPLAGRNQTLKILPAPLDDQTLRNELQQGQNVAIIKVGRHLKRIKTLLEQSGLMKHAVLVSHASQPQENIVALSHYDGDEAPYFSIILCAREGE